MDTIRKLYAHAALCDHRFCSGRRDSGANHAYANTISYGDSIYAAFIRLSNTNAFSDCYTKSNSNANTQYFCSYSNSNAHTNSQPNSI